ncbi:MAG: hypothetical protein ABJD11_04435 [Gemmatimonadota bacterium]
MRLTLTRPMVDALDGASDKPDWLIERLARLKGSPEPYVLALTNEESTALEELCAMNIRFAPDGSVLPQHAALDALSTMVMENY